MTVTEFFYQELIKNHLLFSIYDVDEFVLREVERIKSSNTIDIWDVSKAERYYFEINQVGNEKHQEDSISKEEYWLNKEQGINNCFTRLNYEDFQENFPLDEFQSQYSDEWLINFHYDKAFLPNAIKWIEEAGGDRVMSLRIKKISKELKRSQNALENIKYSWHTDIPLNNIQKAVIEIFKRFYETMLKGLKEHFIDIFPKLFINKAATEAKKERKNPHPRIFINLEGFIFFEKLKEHICKKERTALADYSFVFRQLQYDKYIYDDLRESTFRNFLEKEYKITDIGKLKTIENCSPQSKIELYNLLKD